MAAVFGVDGILTLLFVVSGVLGIWALVDMIIRPHTVWAASRHNKALWIIGLLVALWLALIPGGVTAIVYFTVVRPDLREAAGMPDD